MTTSDVIAISERDAFQGLLDEMYFKIKENDPLASMRANAWKRFLTLGLPSRKQEAFQYVPLKKLFTENYDISSSLPSGEIDSYILPECKDSALVFVNGHFMPSLSRTEALPKNAFFNSLPGAMKTYGGFLNSQWVRSSKNESDPFVELNAALHQEGLFLYFPPKTQCDTPIQILNILSNGGPALIFPRVHIFVGAQSKVSFISNYGQSMNKYMLNAVVEISIEEAAQVRFTQLATETEEKAWIFDAFRANLKRDSVLKTVAITEGAATVRHDYRIVLEGENGEASLNGLSFLKGKREAHTHVLMDHRAPHCRSMQLFKGVSNDTAHSSFEGKILVRQAAQKTEAFQLNNNLLLSDHARTESKPNLEIFADDVKASHGATVGQLDQEQVFYMETRGFSPSQAKNLLIKAYCQEILDRLETVSVLHSIQKNIGSYSAND